MKNYLIVCLIVCFCVSSVVCSQYRQISISKYCGTNSRHETIELDDDDRTAIVLRSPENYRNYLDCSVSVKADKGYGIMVTLRSVNMRNIVDKLAIDVNSSLRPEWTGSSPIAKKESLSYIGERKIRIKFSTLYSPESTQHKGFVLILTSYRKSSVCRESEISCGPNQCVSSSFLCDGHNNCGDNSDEILCLDDQSTSNLAMVGTAMAALVVFLLMCYCCRCCCCCFGSKKIRKDYIPFNEPRDQLDYDKVETTFNEHYEPSAPNTSHDYVNYGGPYNGGSRFPANPNYPYCMDNTFARPQSSDMLNYIAPPPYTPKENN